MKKAHYILVLFLLSSTFGFSQGTIRGKVTDKNGETVIGAPIVLKANRSIGVTTDLDGNYSLKITDTTSQVLIVSYVGYTSIEETVHPKKNEVLIRNFIMESASQSIKEVEITAKALRSRDSYMEKMKTSSTVTLDYISSETMKKTGDANVVSAVARVSGVSTNGGFITVRGIGDRYIKTAINGLRIPTLDPFTNNIKLDLFPASLIDNVIISKTASPDLPGDWAGAYLSVETKDYPDELSLNIETSVGYNSQSTFNDYISSQRSSTDWLGYDNNFRDHDHESFVAAQLDPTTYQEFIALGLGTYFNSIGVTQENWTQDHANGDTYFKLGLIQLGLLSPALINNSQAFMDAKNLYTNGNYQSEAFKKINADVPASGQSFAANWNTIKRKAPLNFSQGFSIGNQFKLFGQPFGFIAGFRYGNSVQNDPASTSNRAGQVGLLVDTTIVLVPSVTSALTQESSVESNGWSGLINLAYKLNSNNSVSVLFMPNFSGVNKVRKSYDSRDEITVITYNQFYEQRKQLVYQVKSEHYIPGPKIKIEFNASYTDGKSSAPDFKNLQFWRNPDSTYQIDPSIGDGMTRYYRYLTDNLFDSKFSAEIPLNSKPDLSRKIKLGVAYQRNEKKNDQYSYEVFFGPTRYPLLNEDIDAYLNLIKFGIRNDTSSQGHISSTIDAYYTNDLNPAYHTFGNSSTKAGFVMLDYSFFPSLRFSGGLRVEQTNVFTDVNEFDALGYAENDIRRVYSSSSPIANPGKLDKTSYLPSASLIYKIRDNEKHIINLRLNYSQTVAHPSMRELSDIALYDYEYRKYVYGNSKLRSVKINNYDLRCEAYFKSGNNISVSVFNKDFKDHIEFVSTSSGNTWQNVDKSNVKGIEIEGSIGIIKQLEFKSNVTLVWSKTEFIRARQDLSGGLITFIPEDTLTRTMAGQAPYVVNAILSYTSIKLGLTATLSYNIQGPRLVITSDNSAVPDIHELPQSILDFKISKSLLKHFTVSFTARDILKSSIRRAYDYPEGYNVLDYDKYTYGSNYVLGIAYKL